jgi:DNA modification methylase
MIIKGTLHGCGDAAIYYGDCRDFGLKLHSYKLAQLAFFSTPYPDMLNWNVSVDEYFWAWLPMRLATITQNVKPDTGVIIQNIWLPRTHDGRYNKLIFEIPEIYARLGWHLIETYIWDKMNAPPAGNMNRHDRNEYEFCFAFAKTQNYIYHKFREPYAAKTIGKAATGNMRKPDINGHLAGGHSRLHPDGAGQGNILRYSSSGDQNRPRIRGRVFPRGLAERFILQYSDPGDLVYDPFCGSGTTLVMAVKNGRLAVGCEIDPETIAVARDWLVKVWKLERSKESEK